MSTLFGNTISDDKKKSFWKDFSFDSSDSVETIKQCLSIDNIPDKYRSTAWKALLDKSIAQLSAEENFGYEELVDQSEDEIKDLLADIDSDINSLDEEDEDVKATLKKILKAFSLHDAKNQYLLGLALIAQVLLKYVSETDVFFILILLFDKNFKPYFGLDAKGYVSETRVIKSLLSERDNSIFNHMNTMDIDLNPYFTRIFTSFFIRDISEEMALHILDICFCIIAYDSANVGFSVDTIIDCICVELAITASSSFIKKDDIDEAQHAIKKGFQKLSEVDTNNTIQNALTFANSLPDYKINAYREKHQATVKSELEERERGLWSEVTVEFGEGALGLTLGSSGPFVIISRFKRQSNGLPGVAEQTGLLDVGAVLIAVNDTPIQSKKKKGSASAAVKEIKAAGRPVNLKFVERSVLEQKLEESKSKKSSYLSDSYLPDYLLVGEKIMVNVESNFRVPLIKGSFYELIYEYHKGRMIVTNYRIIFHPYLKLKNGKKDKSTTTTPRSPRSPKEGEESDTPSTTTNTDISPIPIEETTEETIPGPLGVEDWQCPLLAIDQIKEVGAKNIYLILKAKQTIHFQFGSSKSTSTFTEYIENHAFPAKYDDVFAYRPEARSLIPSNDLNGWSLYDAYTDYERIGLLSCPKLQLYMQGYDTNPTYPQRFLIPSGIDEDEFAKVCKYRSKARVPCAVWMHPKTHAVLCRCAQPMVGIKVKRCPEDEKHLRLLMGAGGAKTDHYYIVDARSRIAAMGNQAGGKGTENLSHYPGADILFMNIANIHAARTSLQKMVELYSPDFTKGDEDFYKLLSDALWYEQVHSILVSLTRIVEYMEDEGCSVLAHCSDGWDRTAQMVAGGELCMDPYYRTLKGFEILIEKEWCSFGHQFRLRTGADNHDFDEKQRSPVFLLFLDCLYQIMCQYPTVFEFNENLLLFLADHFYSGRFGTFLYDCERQKMERSGKTKTVSIWTYVNDPANIQQFMNNQYEMLDGSIYVDCSFKHLRIWDNYWLRNDPTYFPKKQLRSFV
ncbi:hypothetical protein WA158_007869 [Blastocystis sp. Blastoise]